MIVDASVLLSAYFPDEAQVPAQELIREHVAGRRPLLAPTLLVYELTNAVVQAIRRERIDGETGEAILASFEGLQIELRPASWRQILPMAQRCGRSAYDAAYLALAEATGQPLVTGDRRLYLAVGDEMGWVRWVGDVET